MILLANKPPPILRIQCQKLISVQRNHGWPVGPSATRYCQATPASPAIAAGDNLHLATINSRCVCVFVGHERRDECAADVDDVWSTSLAVVGGRVDSCTGIPGSAVVLRKDCIDGEATNFGVFKDTASAALVGKCFINV